ncbi:transglycosylase SLT domain-containing protein [Endozoicomonas sp. Mp262]|uniref:transglycosylase SLT domain-containing protein n=1 Tax=Endozoicomonas sp. Mp262 TaxID=2919499 RepID=UPI0021D85104
MATFFYRLGWVFIFPLVLSGCVSNAKKMPARKPVNTCNICSVVQANPDWYRQTEKAAKRWGSSTPLMMAMIKKESDFRHNARPVDPRTKHKKQKKYLSSAYGYAQALDGTWKHYRKQTGKYLARRDNFADCVQFIGWYNEQSRKKCRIKRHDAYNLYLAYHEGHEGYNRKTHRKKKKILNYARQVENQAKQYAAQLKCCSMKKERTLTPVRTALPQKRPVARTMLSQRGGSPSRQKLSQKQQKTFSEKISSKKSHQFTPGSGAGKVKHGVRPGPPFPFREEN